MNGGGGRETDRKKLGPKNRTKSLLRVIPIDTLEEKTRQKREHSLYLLVVQVLGNSEVRVRMRPMGKKRAHNEREKREIQEHFGGTTGGGQVPDSQEGLEKRSVDATEQGKPEQRTFKGKEKKSREGKPQDQEQTFTKGKERKPVIFEKGWNPRERQKKVATIKGEKKGGCGGHMDA